MSPRVSSDSARLRHAQDLCQRCRGGTAIRRRPFRGAPYAPAVIDAAQLAAATARHVGHDVRVDDLRRLSGGASRETWAFTAIGSEDTLKLVLRRDPAAGIAGSRATEFELLRAARKGGVAVPEVVFLLDTRDDLGAGFVMRHVDGETIPRKILRDDEFSTARARLTEQCAHAAAGIHAIEPRALPALPNQDAAAQLKMWEDALTSFGEPRPAFELALKWLADEIPEATPAQLVHGDFRLGNFIVGPEGLRAVLDWELAHLGDPVEDLGWLCVKSWRFGGAPVVGGFGDAAELLGSYERAGGTPPDEARLRWWTVMGTVKWGLIARIQAETHLSGALRSVELATLGRRVAEMEWDVLALLEGGW